MVDSILESLLLGALGSIGIVSGAFGRGSRGSGLRSSVFCVCQTQTESFPGRHVLFGHDCCCKRSITCKTKKRRNKKYAEVQHDPGKARGSAKGCLFRCELSMTIGQTRTVESFTITTSPSLITRPSPRLSLFVTCFIWGFYTPNLNTHLSCPS